VERHRRRLQPEQTTGQQREEMQPARQDAVAGEPNPAQQTAARRRRRAQILTADEHEHSVSSAPVQAADEGARPVSAAKKENVQLPSGQIPRLPRAEVETKEERSGRQRILKTPAAKKEHEEEDTLRRQYTGKINRSQLRGAKSAHAAKAKDSVKKAGDGAKSVLGFLGGVALLLVMAAGEGVRKLGALISEWRSGAGNRVSVHGHAPQRDEYVLEAIRPEDYHGRAQSRSEHMHHGMEHHRPDTQKKPAAPDRRNKAQTAPGSWRRPDLQQIISLVLAGVAVFSFCMIVSILWRTVRTNRLNKQLTQMYNQAAVVQADEPQDDGQSPRPAQEMIVFMPEETPQIREEEMTGEAEMDAAYERADEPEQAAQFEPTPEPAITPLPMGKRTYHQVGGDALPQMETLHKENRDIVGWLKIENVLDQPVVYRDNSYYLTRDFYKQKNSAGTIFLDVNHPFKEKTQNLLLHGHNMKDGTMFGRLLQYETDLNYVRWHPFVRFDTLWRQEEYVIFAVLRVSLDVRSKDFFNYFSHPTFSSDSEFESYIRQLQLRSIYAIPIDVKPTDALLTMSTCLDDDRLVIVARRVREGESHMQLREWTNLTTRQ